MKRTGEILKKSREEKGLSLHEVGLFLKINTRILQAIEEGDQSQLPAKTFLRGFVQSYAKFLKLEPASVLRVFNEEMSPPPPTPVEYPTPSKATAADEPTEAFTPAHIDEDPEEEVEAKAPLVESSKEDDSLKDSILAKSFVTNDSMKIKTIAASVLGLFLVLFVYFANNVVKKYKREAELSPETPIAAVQNSEDVIQEDVKSVPVETPTGSTLVESALQNVNTPIVPVTSTPVPTTATQVSPPPTPVPVVVAAPAPLPKPLPVPTPAPVVLTPPTKPAVPAPAPATTTTITPASPASTASTTTPVAEGKTVEVIVEAKDNVEIEYSSAKSSPQKIIMKVDQIHTFKSRSGVRLKVSNGGAVNVIVNGQDRGAPGAAGQSIQLSYD